MCAWPEQNCSCTCNKCPDGFWEARLPPNGVFKCIKCPNDHDYREGKCWPRCSDKERFHCRHAGWLEHGNVLLGQCACYAGQDRGLFSERPAVSAVSCPTGEFIAVTKTADNTAKCYACPSRASATAYRVEEELNDSGGFTAKCHYSDGVKEDGVKGGEPTVGDVISPIAVPSSVPEYVSAIMTPMPAEGCSWPATRVCLSTQSSQPCGSPTEAGCSCNCSKCPEGFQVTYVVAGSGPTCGKCNSSHGVLLQDKCYAFCAVGEQMRCPWGECGCYQLPGNVASPTLFEHTVMFTLSCPAGLPAEGTYGYSDQKCYVCPHGGDRVQKIYPSGEVKCVGRAQCGNAACTAAISSIDDAVLFLMKTGLTVSPRPRRVLVVARTRSKRVYMRARSGVLTQMGPPGAGLRRAARGQSFKGIWILRRLSTFGKWIASLSASSRHGMRSPREHREADALDPRHL